jgi:hypothetical protein
MVEERTSIEERPSEFSEIEPAPRRGARGVTGAVLLIGLGTALLLSNLGVITLSWLTLIQFWPVVLILIGLDIAFGGRSAAGSVVVALVALAVVFGVIFWSGFLGNTVGEPNTTVAGEFAHEIADANALRVELDLGMGDIEVGALDGGVQAVSGNYRTDSQLQIEDSYRVEDGTGIFTIEQNSNNWFGGMSGGEIDLLLTNALPLDLSIDAGMGALRLDLSDLILTNVSVDGGMGSIQMTLPDGQSYQVNIDAGMGSMDIDLPEDAEIRIVYDSGVGSLNIDNDRFTENDDGIWETEGYTQGSGIEINIDSGMGSVNFD